jgi:aquaporin Z
MKNFKKYIAELIGTFALVLIGCGSAVIAGEYIGFLGISLAFGLVLLALVFTIGGISGCHVNPAVTIGMLIVGKIKSKDAGWYIIFQCIGAIIAAGLLLMIASGQPGYSLSIDGLGQNGYETFSPAGFSLISCFIAELVLTALFIFIILGSTSKFSSEGFAGISIGFSLAFIHIIGIPITGTSVNPARSLGPALFVGTSALSQLWLFIIAPIIGGIIAALIWRSLYLTDET